MMIRAMSRTLQSPNIHIRTYTHTPQSFLVPLRLPIGTISFGIDGIMVARGVKCNRR
jgi:hypothetical protein